MKSLSMRGTVAALLCICVVLHSGCDNTANLTDAEHVQRAKDMRQQGKLPASVIELKNALQKNPDNREARWLLGHVYIDAGNGDQAVKELERAGQLGVEKEALVVPLLRARLLKGETDKVIAETMELGGYPGEIRPELLAIRGDALLVSNRPDEARATYDEALSLKPDFPPALLGLARLEAQGGRLAIAHERLALALKGAPKAADAWAFSGDLLKVEGKLKEAHEAYDKAVDYSYGRPDIVYNRALVRIDLGMAEEAKKDLDRLSKINPDHPGILYGKGMLQFRAQHFVEAQTAFEGVLTKSPDYLPAVYHLALTHLARNQLQQAEQYINQLRARSPGSVDVQKMLATLKLRRADHAGAEQILRPLLQRLPQDVALLDLMADVALARGNATEALEYIQRSLQLQPQAASSTREKLGLGLLMKGDTEQGLQELERAAEAEPGFGKADLTLVLSYLRLRQYDKAIAAAQKYGSDGKDPMPYNLIGTAYLVGKGDMAKARAAFEEALKRAPGDPTSTINLAELEIQKQDLDSAAKHYGSLLKQNPGNLNATLRLGDLRQRQGKQAEALELYTNAMTRYPDRLEPRLSLARLKLIAGQPQEARALLSEVRASFQNNADFLTLYGQAALASRDVRDAVAIYQHLVQLEPQSGNSHFLLSQAQAAAGNVAQAKAALETAVRLAPRHIQARSALARIAIVQGNIPTAQQYVDRFAADFPNQAESFQLRGMLAERRGDMNQAIAIYTDAMKRLPKAGFASQLAAAQWRAQQPAAAIATLKRWFDANPDDGQAGYTLANFYGAQNRPELAKATLAKVLERQPDNVVVLNDLSLLMSKDNPAKALDYARKAARLSKNPAIQDTLGLLLLERGDTAQALQVFEQARAGARIPTVEYHYALALSRSGRKTEARNLLRQLLKDARAFPERAQAEALLKTLG